MKIKRLQPAILVLLFTQIIQAQIHCLPNVRYQDLSYWRANSVFIGLVEKVSSVNDSAAKEDQITTDSIKNLQIYTVKFEVEKTFRGTLEKTVEFTTNAHFVEGRRYFVYAVRGKDEKLYKLDDGFCGTPPILLEDAGENIEYAEEIAEGKSGTRIYGQVRQDKQDDFKTPRRSVPLAEIEVTIKNEKNTFTTKTDAAGNYIFKNIPAGAYEITSSIPEGMRRQKAGSSGRFGGSKRVFLGECFAPDQLFAVNSKEQPKTFYFHSDSYNLSFTNLSSIEGKIVDNSGKHPPQMYVWLLPVDENGEFQPDGSIRSVWSNSSDGKFVFDEIPKGKYLIAVNRFNCHSDIHPEYGRNIFPDVSAKTDAIKVGENQSVKLKEFKLLPRLKERQFSGTVLSADKSPAANAIVFVFNKEQANPNECFSARITVKTDKFGRFKVKGFQGYEYQIRAYIELNGQNSKRLYSEIIELPTNGSVKDVKLILEADKDVPTEIEKRQTLLRK